MKDYIISGYEDKTYRILEKVLNKLETKENMINFNINRVWENNALNIYIKSKFLKYHNGESYCNILIKNDELSMVINDIDVAILYPENNSITHKYIDFIKKETNYVNNLLDEIINELNNE